MRFLKKNKSDIVYLCISDLHLGAGHFFNGKKNNLEDFYYDKELVEFLQFYRKGIYEKKSVELIINGDFLDFLAVPYVEYFDDEFWSEEASLDKLKIIMSSHKEVFKELKLFLEEKNKKITYVIGNHDAELALTKVRNYFFEFFDGKMKIISDHNEGYRPHPEIHIAHGHQKERANSFQTDSVLIDEKGREYLIPPWGSYYVVRVINRFKLDRSHVNSVRPIKKFVIDGLIYDTYQTFRFLFATIYYYLIVRFIYVFKEGHLASGFFNILRDEFDVFNAPEEKRYEQLLEEEDLKVLMHGHTHKPEIRFLNKEKVFINTGTWTNMYQLDFGRAKENEMLTYAKISVSNCKDGKTSLDTSLLVWKGVNPNPFVEFS